MPVDEAEELETFDAAIVGGALYANRWPRNLRRFVNRNIQKLRKMPVWFFSSGPLDDSADQKDIPPTTQLAVLAAIAWHYFRVPGAREPLPTALVWTGMVMLADLVIVAGLILHSLEMFGSIAGSWLRFTLIFLSTWATGEVIAVIPPHSSEHAPEQRAA